MYGPFKLYPKSGVNPNHSPAYPLEWDCTLRTVEVVTRVAPDKIAAMLEGSGFEPVNDRVAFRFMLSPGHTLSIPNGEMFDLMITVPVRYGDLYTQTHVYMYCSDPMGMAAGRELFGYTKKDCTYLFSEDPAGAIRGWVNRRGFQVAEFAFVPDPDAPLVRLVDADEQPTGEIHVRRLPHPERQEPAYEDVVYRKTPLAYTDPIPGRIEMNLYSTIFDPIADMEPEILGAHFMTSSVYAGGFDKEDRRLLKVLRP